MNRRSLALSVAFVAGLFAMPLPASAVPVLRLDVMIDDRTETPSATINGSPVTLLPDSQGEFLHFSVPLSTGAAPGLPLSVSRDLLEPDGTTFSDRLFMSLTTGISAADVQFGSDPATAPVSSSPFGPGSISPLIEDGTFQPMFILDNAGIDFVTFFVASHVEAVPGPIAGAGLLGLVLASGGLLLLGWWRRRQKIG
jgi:hypothetical protein